MPQRRRFLGDLDAATDQNFAQHFVESTDLAKLLTCHSDVIYGVKGVGKTALRRALAELRRDHFFTTTTLDLDNINFAQAHAALEHLRAASSKDMVSLARTTWRNVLAMYALEAFAASGRAPHGLLARVQATLVAEGFHSNDSNARLLGQIERVLLRIGELGLEESAMSAPLGLTEAQRAVIGAFPRAPEVRELLMEASGIVRESGKHVLVCLDGFDSIVDHTPEARRAIFAGLIDAIHKNSRDELIARAFCFKAFLPSELTEQAQSLVWDADKFIDHTHRLTWSEENFQALVRTRLLVHSRGRSREFVELWHEFMPERLRNVVHRFDENTFLYLLRHTQFRPRQLLAQLQGVLDRWDETSDAFRVDPTFIPSVVASRNFELASSVVSQMEFSNPGIGKFLRSWSGASCVMPVAVFRDRMSRTFGVGEGDDLNRLFDTCYDLGLFGVAQKMEPPKAPSYVRFRFAYVGVRSSRNVHATVDGTDLVALCPMFHEFCGTSPSVYGPILPVAS